VQAVELVHAELLRAGFVRCPNSRTRWYAGGPGIMEPAYPLELRVDDDRIMLTVQPYGKVNESDAVPVMRFADVADLVHFLGRHGRVSEPGLPAYSNGVGLRGKRS